MNIKCKKFKHQRIIYPILMFLTFTMKINLWTPWKPIRKLEFSNICCFSIKPTIRSWQWNKVTFYQFFTKGCFNISSLLLEKWEKRRYVNKDFIYCEFSSEKRVLRRRRRRKSPKGTATIKMCAGEDVYSGIAP